AAKGAARHRRSVPRGRGGHRRPARSSHSAATAVPTPAIVVLCADREPCLGPWCCPPFGGITPPPSRTRSAGRTPPSSACAGSTVPGLVHPPCGKGSSPSVPAWEETNVTYCGVVAGEDLPAPLTLLPSPPSARGRSTCAQRAFRGACDLTARPFFCALAAT